MDTFIQKEVVQNVSEVTFGITLILVNNFLTLCSQWGLQSGCTKCNILVLNSYIWTKYTFHIIRIFLKIQKSTFPSYR